MLEFQNGSGPARKRAIRRQYVRPCYFAAGKFGSKELTVGEIVVTARFRASEGNETRIESALRAAIAPTHAETGCIRYALHRATNDPRSLIMIERWTSQAALDAHLKTPHIQTLFAALEGLLDAPTEITIWDPASDGTGMKGRL